MSYHIEMDATCDALNRWDDWVDRHPSGTVFNTWRWLQGFNTTPELYCVFDSKHRIVGGMCLIKTRKLGVTGYHIPPYTPYFGPLIDEFNAKKHASAMAHQEKIITLLLQALGPTRHCDFIPTQAHACLLPCYWNRFSVDVRTTYLVARNAGDTGTSWLESIEKSPRSHLRKMQALVDQGILSVERSNRPDQQFFEMIQAVGDRKHFNPRIQRLETLISGLSNEEVLAISVTDASGEPLAGDLCVVDAHRYYMLASFRHPDWKQKCPHAHLLTRSISIKSCIDEGKVFDFEGSMIRGVADFNRSLGGKPVALFRVQRSRSLLYTAARFIRRLKHEYGTS